MTDAGKAFWPVYDEYEAQLKKIDDRYMAMINDYATKYDTLTDAEATQMLKERLAIDRKRVELKIKYTSSPRCCRARRLCVLRNWSRASTT